MIEQGKQKKCYRKACECCSESVMRDERCILVTLPPKGKGKGKTLVYCLSCESVAHNDNPEAIEAAPHWQDANDGEAGLRQAEDFAAYQAAGNTAAYWTDRDAGLTR